MTQLFQCNSRFLLILVIYRFEHVRGYSDHNTPPPATGMFLRTLIKANVFSLFEALSNSHVNLVCESKIF